MNLNVIQRQDPQVVDILESATQAAVYVINPSTTAWVPLPSYPHPLPLPSLISLPLASLPPSLLLPSFHPHEQERQKCEGPLFVFRRSSPPWYGLVVLNRVAMENYFDILVPGMVFECNDKLLSFRNQRGSSFFLIKFSIGHLKTLIPPPVSTQARFMACGFTRSPRPRSWPTSLTSEGISLSFLLLNLDFTRFPLAPPCPQALSAARNVSPHPHGRASGSPLAHAPSRIV